MERSTTAFNTTRMEIVPCPSTLGVAVIGAGMAGRAHAAGYRAATSMFETDLPGVRLVAIADAYEPFAVDVATRFGYERSETCLAGDRRRRRHRRRQRRDRQRAAPPGRRGPARGRQARAVREADGPDDRGRAGDGRGRRRPRAPSPASASASGAPPRSPRSVTSCRAGTARYPRATSTATTGATTRRTRRTDQLALQGRARQRSAGRHRQPPRRPR